MSLHEGWDEALAVSEQAVEDGLERPVGLKADVDEQPMGLVPGEQVQVLSQQPRLA